MSTKIELKNFMTDILTFSLYRVGFNILYIYRSTGFSSVTFEMSGKKYVCHHDKAVFCGIEVLHIHVHVMID
jgi:hypothetical protein